MTAKPLQLSYDEWIRQQIEESDKVSFNNPHNPCLPSLHGVVTQGVGKFMDMDCTTTLHQLDSGESIKVSRVIGQEIFDIRVMSGYAQETERLRYQDPSAGIKRVLRLADQRIVGVTIKAPWDELSHVYRMLVDHTLVAPWQIVSFERNGTLRAEAEAAPHNASEFVCECMEVRRETLQQAIRSGCQTFEAVTEATGAGTVCGACRPLVQATVGQVEWTPVSVSEVIRVAADIYTLRFTTRGGPFAPAQPGQHIVVQAKIEGRLLERSYTLTSTVRDRDYREITIKRESLGVFSRWLVDHGQDDASTRISEPQGNNYPGLTAKQPVVCLVAGIGMTPALALCRSIIQEQSDQYLQIHYSASTREQFAYLDELRSADEHHANIYLTTRTTREEGRLTQTDVKELVQNAPNALFFVCGPSSYISSVRQFLMAAQVPAERIHVEAFAPASRLTDETETPQDFSSMPYLRFVEKVLNKEIVLPKVSGMTARLQSEQPELFEPDNTKMTLITALLIARLALTAVLLGWAASHEHYLLAALLAFVQGVNYFSASAVVHDLAHGSAFTRGWLNRLLGTLLSLPLLSRFSAFQRSHLLHHRKNQSMQDPKVNPRSGNKAQLAHFIFDRLFTPLPTVLQNIVIVAGMLTVVPFVLLLRYEFSVFQRVRSLDDLREVAAILVLWVGVFSTLGWQVATLVMIAPLFVGYACIVLVFETHASEHSVNSMEYDQGEYELMIFNITNLTMGPIIDRLSHYFWRYHVEHHLFPSIPFHRLARASQFVQREYGCYLLPMRNLDFQYIKRGYLDNTRNNAPIDIAGKRYFVGSFFRHITFADATIPGVDK